MSDVIDDSPDGRLRAAWVDFVAPDTGLFDRLASRHRERHRRYHRLDHVDDVVRHVADLAEHTRLPAGELSVVVAAAMYHDAVYEPRSSANERASARLARRDLLALGWQAEQVEAVATMIEGTAHHTDPPDAATAVLYDADLAILGADPSDYEVYRAAIRTEYQHVDDHDWSVGRAEMLRSFLGRTAIYTTERAVDRWETAARRNLTAELASLTA